jgi:hypothetical protein
MALSQNDKDTIKNEWDEMCRLAKKFSRGSVEDLYVIDKDPLLDGAEDLAALVMKLPRAAWTRGKQGHGK